jgi:heme/copper-type cytochrome/quinol oxidase subunit 3
VSAHGGALSHHEHEAAENTRLGMWVFLGSESVFFATLIGSYLALHNKLAGGPGPLNLFNLEQTGAASIALLLSSVTMALAVSAAHRGQAGRVRLWLVVTVLLGLAFLANQALEFTDMWSQGLTLTSSAFGSAFYTLTGFHGLHVTFGVLWLLVSLAHSLRRRREGLSGNEPVQLEIAGLYWAFVDVVWIVIFTVVYLIGDLS